MMKRWQLRRGDYEAARLRRREFRALLAEHRRSEELDAHELVFGELVTNAVRHGDDPMSVVVAVSDEVVQIHVENAGRCFELERCLAKTPTSTGGRGLGIVYALAKTLTVERSPVHTCRVTATLPL